MICMLYLLVIVILVIIILSKQTKKIQNFRLFRGARASVEAAKSVKIMGFRILLYPIIMIVSQSGLVINQTAYDLFDFEAPELFILTMITSGMLGTLNFTAFCCDPTIHSAFRKIYLRITAKNRIQDIVNDEVGSEVMLSTRDNLDDIDQSNSSFTFTEKVDGKMLTEIIQSL
ncbi:hypothetical protein K502DRAFT_94465 [Neoconidiobolus thromboides FSU 785]|nr:hypothetical protein K502DRAFT_94465 [Neoconidiobolus thromboides FSU 785]